jgi:hypothetical protein
VIEDYFQASECQHNIYKLLNLAVMYIYRFNDNDHQYNNHKRNYSGGEGVKKLIESV